MTTSVTDLDRTVHAGIPDGGAIVRYDHNAAWYLEWPPAAGKKRRRLSVREAAVLAEANEAKDGAFIAFGRPGGTRFDSMVRSIRSSINMFDEDMRDTVRAEMFLPLVQRLES